MTESEFRRMLYVHAELHSADMNLEAAQKEVEDMLCAAHRERVRPLEGEYPGRLNRVRQFAGERAPIDQDDLLQRYNAILAEDAHRMREAGHE